MLFDTLHVVSGVTPIVKTSDYTESFAHHPRSCMHNWPCAWASTPITALPTPQVGVVLGVVPRTLSGLRTLHPPSIIIRAWTGIVLVYMTQAF